MQELLNHLTWTMCSVLSCQNRPVTGLSHQIEYDSLDKKYDWLDLRLEVDLATEYDWRRLQSNNVNGGVLLTALACSRSDKRLHNGIYWPQLFFHYLVLIAYGLNEKNSSQNYFNKTKLYIIWNIVSKCMATGPMGPLGRWCDTRPSRILTE